MAIFCLFLNHKAAAYCGLLRLFLTISAAAYLLARYWFNCMALVLYRLRITWQTIDNRGLFRGFKPFKQILAGLVLQAIKTPVIP
jgi:hypothetical protein